MKLKYIWALAGIMGLGTSCSDVIDLHPLDSFTDESYWRSVNDLEKYANSFYGNLGGAGNGGDTQSDNRVTTNYDTWLFNEYLVDNADDWSWTNIRNLNFFMARYQRVQGTEADINAQVAKIRFFRALDYFGKIKSYGDVPWYDRDLAMGDTEELFKDRDPRDFVLQKVIEDLEYAIEWLPEKEAAERCALHKDAARTLLSRVCLYYGTYKKYHGETGTTPSSEELLRKCADVCEDIMNTGRYAIVKGDNGQASMIPDEGYPMDYQNQFVQESLDGNAEAILYREYVAGVSTHGLGRSPGCGFSKDFAESFLCKDGLPIGVSPLYIGDETLDDEMTNRDPRMYQIIDNIHRPYRIQSDGRKEYNHAYNDLNASGPDVSASGSVTGYANVKWTSADPEQWTANASTFDWFIYRYAEVLLNYAEAKYELNEMSQEVLDQTINLIRDRVDMPHLTMNPVEDPNAPDYGYVVDPLLNEIRRERRIELAADGFRYDDIIRWKATKLFENPKTFLGMRVTDKVIALYQEGTFGGETGRALVEYEGKTYIRPYAKELNDPGRVWTDNDKRFLNPLSKNVLLINPNLKQNPGWED